MKPSTAMKPFFLSHLFIFTQGICLGGAIVYLSSELNQPKPLSETAWLRACAQVESGGKLDAVGRAGELGEYQMSPDIIMRWLRSENALKTDSDFGQYRQIFFITATGHLKDFAAKDQTAAAQFHLHELEVSHQTFSPRRLFELWRGKDDEEYLNRAMNLYNQYSK